jgi:hypothetical protein
MEIEIEDIDHARNARLIPWDKNDTIVKEKSSVES